MNNPHGIILLGANGSGKSTLGWELARVLNFAHFTDLDGTLLRRDKTISDYTASVFYRCRKAGLL